MSAARKQSLGLFLSLLEKRAGPSFSSLLGKWTGPLFSLGNTPSKSAVPRLAPLLLVCCWVLADSHVIATHRSLWERGIVPLFLRYWKQSPGLFYRRCWKVCPGATFFALGKSARQTFLPLLGKTVGPSFCSLLERVPDSFSPLL